MRGRSGVSGKFASADNSVKANGVHSGDGSIGGSLPCATAPVCSPRDGAERSNAVRRGALLLWVDVCAAAGAGPSSSCRGSDGIRGRRLVLRTLTRRRLRLYDARLSVRRSRLHVRALARGSPARLASNAPRLGSSSRVARASVRRLPSQGSRPRET